MKNLAVLLLLISTSSFAALKWEPGSILSIKYTDVKHNFKINDISYYDIDESELSEADKEAIKIATFEIEARLKVCADKVSSNGKVKCYNLDTVPINGSMDNTILLEDLGFMKTYEDVQVGIDKIMDQMKVSSSNRKEEGKLNKYHFRLNFYKQSAKASSGSKIIHKVKIFPSKLGNGYKSSIYLHSSKSKKITGKGYGMIVNY